MPRTRLRFFVSPPCPSSFFNALLPPMALLPLAALFWHAAAAQFALPEPDANFPIDELLGPSFSQQFYNCTANSSATSWCGQSNAYVIAQPLAFTYSNSSGTTAPAPSSAAMSTRFQQMKANYHRAWQCDGLDADAACRLVNEAVYLDQSFAAPVDYGTGQFCSFTDDCELFVCDLPACKFCDQSPSNCENICNGTFCNGTSAPAPAPPFNSTASPWRRLIALSLKVYDPDSAAVQAGFGFFDENLNVVTEGVPKSYAPLMFIISVADPDTGFKWVIDAQDPTPASYASAFQIAYDMGMNKSVPRADCMYVQSASPNPTFSGDVIASELLSDIFRVIPGTDYNTKTAQFKMNLPGINIGAGFLVEETQTGRRGIIYAGLNATTRVFSSTGVLFLDITELDGDFVQMQSLPHFGQCSVENATTYSHKFFQRNPNASSVETGQGMEKICEEVQLLMVVSTTTTVYIFDMSRDLILGNITNYLTHERVYLLAPHNIQRVPLWRHILSADTASTFFSVLSIHDLVYPVISGAQVLVDPLPAQCNQSSSSVFDAPVGVAVSIDSDSTPNVIMYLSLDEFDGVSASNRATTRAVGNPAGYPHLPSLSPCADALRQFRDPVTMTCRNRRASTTTEIPLTDFANGLSLKSAWVTFGPPQLVELLSAYSTCTAAQDTANASSPDSTNPFAGLIAGLGSSEVECLFKGAVSTGSDTLGYLDSSLGANGSSPNFATYAFGFRNVLYSTQNNRRTYILQVTQTAFREVDCPASGARETTLELVNDDIVNIGQPFFTIPSLNGRFVFNLVERKRWELEAQERAVEVCAALEINPDDVFLSPLSEACTESLRYPDPGDFITVASACPPSVLCESFTLNSLEQLPAGMYSNWNFDQHQCDPGFYCPSGIKTECPTGFYCPSNGMGLPERCPVDPTLSTTCYLSGLKTPQVCANGTVCTAPYLPAQPAGPGYFQTVDVLTNMRVMGNCRPGEYCNLGRSATDDLLCPNSTACANQSVLRPSICDHATNLGGNISYCPAGTQVEMLCPAGYHCPLPDGTKILCRNGSYCPAGTFSWVACTPGFYCPTPARMEVCPAGSYCPAGSQLPLPCGFIAVCGEGASIPSSLVAVVILVFLAFALAIAAWATNKFTERGRQVRAAQRKIAAIHRSPRGKSEGAIELHSRHDAGQVQRSAGVIATGARLEVAEATACEDSSDEALIAEIDKHGDNKQESVMKRKAFTIDFHFESLGLQLKKGGKPVLQGVTGKILHGRVTAVMGPSGAGKSTFVTTLCGKAYYGEQTGVVKINGKAEPFSKYQTITGFVPQEDVMMRTLSVKENLQFSAMSRLPAEMSNVEKRQFVNQILATLDLHEIRHSIIGDEKTRGISGGQRKRVNIGMEMVADPTVLFLDEPTSGLDSTSSMEVCECLQRVASLGLTVITVIHQPRYEIFAAFDDVLLLGKGGRTVYIGPTVDAMNYFESLGYKRPDLVNPADFMMDAIAGTTIDELDPLDLFEHWERHMQRKKEQSTSRQETLGVTVLVEDLDPFAPSDNDRKDSQYKPRQQSGCLTVLGLVLKRSYVQQFRDWTSFVIDNMIVFFAGLMLGLIYVDWSDTCEGCTWLDPGQPIEAFVGCPAAIATAAQPLFMSVTDQINVRGVMTLIVMGLGSVTTMTRVFGSERTQYFREASGLAQPLHTAAYFFGKDLAFLHQVLLGPALYLLPFRALTAPRAGFAQLYAPLVAVYYAAGGIGYIVSIVAAPAVSQLIGVIGVFAFAMFSGGLPVLVQLQTRLPPFSFVEYISFMRYGLEAFYVAEAQHWTQVVELMGTNFAGTAPEDPGYVLSTYGYYFHRYGVDVIIAFAIGFGFRLIAFALMAGLDRNKKL